MDSIREMIEKRAYQLFLKRGGAHGYHMADWIQAEKEVTAESASKKKNETIQPSAPKKESAAPVQTQRASAPTRPVSNTVKKWK
jgi:hypothetical protein